MILFHYYYSFLNRQDLVQQMLVLIEIIIVLKMDCLLDIQQHQILILLKMVYFTHLLHLSRLLVVIYLIFKNDYFVHLIHILHLNLVYLVGLEEEMKYEFLVILDIQYFMELLHIMEQNLVVFLMFVKKRKKKDFFILMSLCHVQIVKLVKTDFLVLKRIILCIIWCIL